MRKFLRITGQLLFFSSFLVIYPIDLIAEVQNFVSKPDLSLDMQAVAIPAESKESSGLIDLPSPATFIPATMVPQPVVTEDAFLNEVFMTMGKLGGVPFMVQLSLILALIVSSFKVTLIHDLFWSKLSPSVKVWVAPGLAAVAGVLGLGADGSAVTPALVLAYMSAGGGAVFVHEVLDSIKTIPKFGDKYKNGIEFVQKLLVKSKIAKRS